MVKKSSKDEKAIRSNKYIAKNIKIESLDFCFCDPRSINLVDPKKDQVTISK